MHELAICGAIMTISGRHAGDREVQAVHVRVGQLRQIVPETLVYCWALVSADTPLAGAELVIEGVAARIRCRACDQEDDLGDQPVFACSRCGGSAVTVVAGEEFLITSLELAEAR